MDGFRVSNMNIILLGAAGFIGTDLALAFLEQKDIQLTLADKRKEYFIPDLLKAGTPVTVI